MALHHGTAPSQKVRIAHLLRSRMGKKGREWQGNSGNQWQPSDSSWGYWGGAWKSKPPKEDGSATQVTTYKFPTYQQTKIAEQAQQQPARGRGPGRGPERAWDAWGFHAGTPEGAYTVPESGCPATQATGDARDARPSVAAVSEGPEICLFGAETAVYQGHCIAREGSGSSSVQQPSGCGSGAVVGQWPTTSCAEPHADCGDIPGRRLGLGPVYLHAFQYSRAAGARCVFGPSTAGSAASCAECAGCHGKQPQSESGRCDPETWHHCRCPSHGTAGGWRNQRRLGDCCPFHLGQLPCHHFAVSNLAAVLLGPCPCCGSLHAESCEPPPPCATGRTPSASRSPVLHKPRVSVKEASRLPAHSQSRALEHHLTSESAREKQLQAKRGLLSTSLPQDAAPPPCRCNYSGVWEASWPSVHSPGRRVRGCCITGWPSWARRHGIGRGYPISALGSCTDFVCLGWLLQGLGCPVASAHCRSTVRHGLSSFLLFLHFSCYGLPPVPVCVTSGCCRVEAQGFARPSSLCDGHSRGLSLYSARSRVVDCPAALSSPPAASLAIVQLHAGCSCLPASCIPLRRDRLAEPLLPVCASHSRGLLRNPCFVVRCCDGLPCASHSRGLSHNVCLLALRCYGLGCTSHSRGLLCSCCLLALSCDCLPRINCFCGLFRDCWHPVLCCCGLHPSNHSSGLSCSDCLQTRRRDCALCASWLHVQLRSCHFLDLCCDGFCFHCPACGFWRDSRCSILLSASHLSSPDVTAFWRRIAGAPAHSAACPSEVDCLRPHTKLLPKSPSPCPCVSRPNSGGFGFLGWLLPRIVGWADAFVRSFLLLQMFAFLRLWLFAVPLGRKQRARNFGLRAARRVTRGAPMCLVCALCLITVHAAPGLPQAIAVSSPFADAPVHGDGHRPDRTVHIPFSPCPASLGWDPGGHSASSLPWDASWLFVS